MFINKAPHPYLQEMLFVCSVGFMGLYDLASILIITRRKIHYFVMNNTNNHKIIIYYTKLTEKYVEQYCFILPLCYFYQIYSALISS